MIEIRVPELGESITEGTIFNWIIKEGESVREGDILLEIETDKVNLEVSAEHNGKITEIKKQAGETVEVGEVLALLQTEVNSLEKNAGYENSEDNNKEDSNKKDNNKEDKNAREQETSEEGTYDEKEDATSGKLNDHERQERVLQTSEEKGERKGGSVASPAARRIARERGVDLNLIQGKDPMGRINKEDINNADANNREKNKPATVTPRPKTPDKEKVADASKENDKPIERIRMSRRRLTIANRLVEAQQNAAMLTTFNEVDMSAIIDIRHRRKESFREKYNVGLGYMSFFTKAVVGALKAFPLLNAEIDGEDILIKRFYDIGVAVSADEGLIVPVIRHADRLSFAEIEQQIQTLAEKARSNSLKLSEIQGGTFTITNGGIFGSLLSTPILNTPQVGILGMHKIQTRPVTIENDRMENRPMMYIALSYDHRIVDGKEAVSFLVRVKELLEDPETLLIEGS